MRQEDLCVFEILTYGHPVLFQEAEKISDIDQNIIDLAENMVFTMHSAPGPRNVK